ncbi:MAG TPA: hypothetical protein VH370_23750 [Humisphaera sp.]|jgi:hypothetical protein|nr:hypothetical protein [Humisphaera sp.]
MTYINFGADSAARQPGGPTRFSARQQGLRDTARQLARLFNQPRGGSHLT